jgi:hypothetical protein
MKIMISRTNILGFKTKENPENVSSSLLEDKSKKELKNSIVLLQKKLESF